MRVLEVVARDEVGALVHDGLLQIYLQHWNLLRWCVLLLIRGSGGLGGKELSAGKIWKLGYQMVGVDL